MRVQSDPWFAEYLLRVGNGTEEDDGHGCIHLPDEICVPYIGEDIDLHRLIEDVFPMLDDNMTDPDYITSRAILSTRNDCVDRINMRMIHRFRGEEMVYHSFDRADDDPHNYYPPEFLNSLTPNGLPPHVLRLKINCPIILLRNIDPANELCNGTRLIVWGFKRKQFSIRLSFAMTINKAQGQTIPHVGVYLPESVFSHGQLYVALSRATARSNIKVLAAPDNRDKKNKKSRQDKTKRNHRQSLGDHEIFPGSPREMDKLRELRSVTLHIDYSSALEVAKLDWNWLIETKIRHAQDINSCAASPKTLSAPMAPLATLLATASILSLLAIFPRATSRDILPLGSSLAVESYQTNILQSSDGTFCCGFYEIYTNAFTFSIWYSKAANKTIVWSANPEHPVHARRSAMTMHKDGNTVLTDYDGTVVWQADGNFTDVQHAQLLNTGNLVIKDSRGNNIWQSFDSPTDTFLPAQYITANTELVPTTQSHDPGNYIFRFSDLSILSLIYKYNAPQVSDIYWPDPDQTIYQDGRNQYNSTRLGILDNSGTLASSDFADGQPLVASDAGPTIKRRLTLDPDGNLRLYSLNDSDGLWSISMIAMSQPCNIHGLCGPNGICHYSPKPTCSCPPGYVVRNPGIYASVTAPVKAFNIRKMNKGIREPFPDVHKTGGGESKWFYFYGFIAAFFVIEVSFISFAWFFVLRRELRPSELWASEEGYKVMTSNFRRYSYRELVKATKKFKVELGKGGSGTVYKGVLEDDRQVAVKKLENVRQGKEEFQAELSIIGRINHMNLVRIWGFCSEGSHRLLVSEYVENGSLASILFNGKRNILLDWKERFNIALGIAKGLAYLHHECLEWVIHCDVKPENILLDQNFEPKITDFGLAKLLNRGGSNQNVSHVRGTLGYIAPEWVSGLPITAKVDVYSYGVVLLELLSGTRISELVEGSGDVHNMHRKVVRMLVDRLEGEDQLWIDGFVDLNLNDPLNYMQARTLIKLAVSCLEEDRSRRPTMEYIVQTLLTIDE
ncbi:hypothetical protein U9M48_042698 [Paspalum notatum var. saurae]|uniref:non-specific serine/threonine protein kinase n=1 Tax=Paspalum notatum var. saurae TaxID=547442 RepID=A0AAQ3UR39_PASNO